MNPSSVCVCSEHSSFLPQSKNKHIRLMRDFKLLLDVNLCVYVCVDPSNARQRLDRMELMGEVSPEQRHLHHGYVRRPCSLRSLVSLNAPHCLPSESPPPCVCVCVFVVHRTGSDLSEDEGRRSPASPQDIGGRGGAGRGGGGGRGAE